MTLGSLLSLEMIEEPPLFVEDVADRCITDCAGKGLSGGMGEDGGGVLVAVGAPERIC